MANPSKSRGTAAEREVVKYLQNWWPAAERRALSGNKDRGDVAGIPGLVVEVKAAERPLLAAWQRETLIEMTNAGATACLLVVKRKYKAAPRWDAYVPINQHSLEYRHLAPGGSFEWLRMDLLLAIAMLRELGY